MSNAKICFLVVSVNAGGVETYLYRFLSGYKNITPYVVTKGGGKGNLYDDYVESGAEIVPFKMGYCNIRSWFKLYNFFRQHKFDAVCDMTANFSGIPLTIAKLASVSTRIAFYRQSSHHFKLSIFNLAYANFTNWLVGKNATVILANSQAALDFYFLDKQDDRFKVIKNGVNQELFGFKQSKRELRKYFGLPLDKFIVGHTGRVAFAKNHETILKVAKEICSQNKDVIFVLAGNGTEKLPSQKGIITMGYCSEIPKLLKTFDTYYFPSVTEGQPNSLIEAMISGLPFVASNIAPIKECVPEQNYSQLIPPLDSEATVVKLNEIINSEDKSTYICKEWAILEYDAQKKFEEFYRELI